MSQLLQRDVIKLPPIKPIEPYKAASPYFDNNSFYQFHHQLGHDTEKCFALKCKIQDLIDNNTISMTCVNAKGNKLVAPPNQKLKIFTNPLPSHTSNVIETEHTSFSPSDFTTTTQNLVNMVGKQETLKDPCIAFDPNEIIRAPDVSLYIVAKIQRKPCHGVLTDPSCMVNVITEECLYTLHLYKPIYDDTNVVFKLFDGFSCPTRLVLSH